MIKAVIIDDEKLARDVIANYLGEFCPDVEIVAQASSVRTALAAIQKTSPDLVFLDIEMPDGNGFDLLSLFEKIYFKIIFITAYSEYAIRAFRFSALDYLLKPVKIDELIDAVARVRSAEPRGISNEIILCQADGYCTNFHLSGNRKVVSSKNLKHFDGLLEDQNFMRVHHSYMINLDHVTGYTRQGEILLSEGLKAYLGDSYKGEFARKFTGK